MEDTKKNSQALPSNYVTLRQLQERRLKEQQQKQREKEEEEEERKREEQRLKDELEKQKREEEETRLQEQRLREEFEKKNQEEEERKLQESTKALEIKSKPSYRPNRRNSRNFPEKNRRTRVEIPSETQKLETDAAVVLREEIPDQGQKLEESKKKKKRKNKYGKNKQKTKAEETLTGDVENGPEEKIPEALVETPARKEGRRSTSWRRAKNPPANIGVSEQKVPVNQTVEITQKIGDLTTDGNENRVEMDGGKEENEKRSTTEMNGGRRKYKGSGRFGHRYRERSRDAGLVWVKKGEISDGTPVQAGFRRRY